MTEWKYNAFSHTYENIIETSSEKIELKIMEELIGYKWKISINTFEPCRIVEMTQYKNEGTLRCVKKEVEDSAKTLKKFIKEFDKKGA